MIYTLAFMLTYSSRCFHITFTYSLWFQISMNVLLEIVTVLTYAVTLLAHSFVNAALDISWTIMEKLVEVRQHIEVIETLPNVHTNGNVVLLYSGYTYM